MADRNKGSAFARENIKGIFASIFVKTLCQYLCQYLWGSAVTLVCLLAAGGAIFGATFPLSKDPSSFSHPSVYVDFAVVILYF